MKKSEAKEKTAYERLKPKQRAFVDAYFQCGMNASEAARRVGYKTRANTAGQRMMSNDVVLAAIQERLRAFKLDADEILTRLYLQSLGDMSDFLTIKKDGTVDIDLRKAQARGVTYLIQKLEVEHGKVTKFAIQKPKEVLELLAKIIGLLKDKEESAKSYKINLSWDGDDAGAPEE